MGKNRVMSLALGRDEASEYNENLHKVSRLLRNQCGLLFTNQKKDSVMDFFTGHEQPGKIRGLSSGHLTDAHIRAPIINFTSQTSRALVARPPRT